jgi:phage tail sheath gpL-like
MKEFLSDTGGRWAWDKQLYGHSFGTTTGTYAQLGTKGELRNNQHETLLGVNKSPSLPGHGLQLTPAQLR